MLLVVCFIFPFDKNAEAAKGYFDVLKEQIGVADKNAIGEINLWDKSTEAYIIYFGNKSYYNYEVTDSNKVKQTKKVFANVNPKNAICSCYKVKEDFKCKYCTSLNYEGRRGGAGYSFSNHEQFVIYPGEKYQIIKLDSTDITTNQIVYQYTFVQK